MVSLPIHSGRGDAFLDENNHSGIGKWLTKKKLGIFMGVEACSGFCTYPLYLLF